MEKDEREKLYKGWKRAVRATQIFAEEQDKNTFS